MKSRAIKFNNKGFFSFALAWVMAAFNACLADSFAFNIIVENI